jgi:phosphocarrier protein HPr
MASVRVSVAFDLHARPAAAFVRAVADSGLAVTIAKDGGEPVDARSILAVLALDVIRGEHVNVTADGEAAAAVLSTLAGLLAAV